MSLSLLCTRSGDCSILQWDWWIRHSGPGRSRSRHCGWRILRPMRLHPVLPFLLLCFALLAAAPLQAGVNRWTSIGPKGGGVTALAFSSNGRTAWAGTKKSGVFRSADNGRTWTAASRGLSKEVYDLAASPAAPGRVYAVTSFGIFMTPIVFMISGVIFMCTAATYTEATTMYPEAGARRRLRGVRSTSSGPSSRRGARCSTTSSRLPSRRSSCRTIWAFSGSPSGSRRPTSSPASPWCCCWSW